MNYTKLPKYLKQYIVEQEYFRYDIIDHSAWRFILNISKEFFRVNAHSSYLNGLVQTGITTDNIPKISEMNKKLNEISWGAVPVRGFIPPFAFMQFQALGILPIAADMRTVNHLTYTPAPDIVHEAAGHAPIVANNEYSNYLKKYGYVASKAISSKEDIDIYNVIRELSDLKENSNASCDQIQVAELELKRLINCSGEPSESALLSRLHWWTVEYGLIGTVDNPKIYGAGLLSSVGESQNCLSKDVKKIPLSLDCINYNYDITEQQPQLFVTPDFKTLSKILDEFSDKMAYKIGGCLGLERGKKSKAVCTIKYDTGIELSGIIDNIIYSKNGKQAIYINLRGPSQLSYNSTQIKNQGPDYHSEGFGCPIGKLKNSNLSITELNTEALDEFKIKTNNTIELNFESGINILGKVINVTMNNDFVQIISLENCTILFDGKALFKPEWGIYDLTGGGNIKSVYGGPSDYIKFEPYLQNYKVKKLKIQPNVCVDSDRKDLIKLYKKVDKQIHNNIPDLDILKEIVGILNINYSDEWLLRIQIFNLTKYEDAQWISENNQFLRQYKKGTDIHHAIIRAMQS